MKTTIIAAAVLALASASAHADEPKLFLDLGLTAITGDHDPTMPHQDQGYKEPHVMIEWGVKLGRVTLSGYHISSVATGRDPGITGLAVRVSIIDYRPVYE